MKEKKKKFEPKEFDSVDEKLESIDNEINSIYKLIDDLKISSLAFVFEKIGNLFDKADEKLKLALQDKLVFNQETTEEYKLEKAITWFRENYSEAESVSGGLFKVEKKRGKNDLKVYHFFIDEEEKKVLTGKNHPLKLVKTERIDKGLQDQFGDEDLILFR